MARKPRVEFEGALYHVIARGNQRLRIPLKSASESEANRPAVRSKAAGGRSEATLEFLS